MRSIFARSALLFTLLTPIIILNACTPPRESLRSDDTSTVEEETSERGPLVLDEDGEGPPPDEPKAAPPEPNPADQDDEPLPEPLEVELDALMKAGRWGAWSLGDAFVSGDPRALREGAFVVLPGGIVIDGVLFPDVEVELDADDRFVLISARGFARDEGPVAAMQLIRSALCDPLANQDTYTPSPLGTPPPPGQDDDPLGLPGGGGWDPVYVTERRCDGELGGRLVEVYEEEKMASDFVNVSLRFSIALPEQP